MKQGAHLTKPGWSKPHTHSNPTNLALFRHKESLDDLIGKKFNTRRVYDICLGRRTESSYCRAMCMLELLMLKRDILFVLGGDFSVRDVDAVIHSLCNDWC